MRQKFIFSFLVISAITFFSACSDDDNPTDKDRLPETARAFLDSRIPEYTILNIETVDDKNDESNEKYVVTLSNDLLVSFSSMGYWRRIESAKELPEKIQQEISYDGAQRVKEKYPSNTINKMYFLPFGYQAELDNGTRLAVYTDNGTDMKVGVIIEKVAEWPQKASEFLKTYYAGTPKDVPYFFFREDESDGSGYRFGLGYGARVNFDKNGDWYNIKGCTQRIYSELLSQEMRNIVEQKYKADAGSVSFISRQGTYYLVMMFFNTNPESSAYHPKWMLFDTTTNKELEPPVQHVLDFLETYVSKPNDDMVLTVTSIAMNRGKTHYRFSGVLSYTEVLNIYMGPEGQMYGITLNGTEIPRKILDYLPAKVKEFVEKNISANNPIIQVMNGYGEQYYIQFKSSIRVVFDKDGNILN